MPHVIHGRFVLATKQHLSGKLVVANTDGSDEVVSALMSDPSSVRDMERGSEVRVMAPDGIETVFRFELRSNA
jgi:hypothetical protein